MGKGGLILKNIQAYNQESLSAGNLVQKQKWAHAEGMYLQ